MLHCMLTWEWGRILHTLTENESLFPTKARPARSAGMQGHEGDEEEELPESEEQEEGGDKPSVSALASSSAAFWQHMLKARWEALQQEDAEGAHRGVPVPAEGDEGDASGVTEEANAFNAVVQS
jgi:hypothetical protein